MDLREIARALGGEVSGNRVVAPGPDHSRKDRSLTITLSEDAPGGFVVHSFAGDNDIDAKDWVRRQLGLPAWGPERHSNVHALPSPKSKSVHPICDYVYETANGAPYLRVTRMSDKSFRQSRWDGQRWQSGKPPGPPIPYRLPGLLAHPDDPVFVVEGEKDADRLTALGLIATSSSGGARNWTADHAKWLSGRDVYVIPDNDIPGLQHGDMVMASLEKCSIIHLPDLPPKGDVSDWLDAGGTSDQLISIALNCEIVPQLSGGPLSPTPFEWIDPSDLPKRQWLYGRHLIRKYVSVTIAPGGLGKSSLAIVEALAMASGKPLLGETVPGPLRVWYWNGEDGQDENRYRTVAAASHYKLKPSDFASRLWQDSGRDKPFLIADLVGSRCVIQTDVIEEISCHILTHKIDVMIIDPLVAAHNVSENDNGSMGAIVRALAVVAERTNCAIELIHHIRKPGSGITTETDINDARGATALIGGVRSARVLNVMSEDEASLFKIQNRLSYFRVGNGKANLAPRSDESLWRRIIGFDLNNFDDDLNSDVIGVVEKWDVPGLFAGCPSNAAEMAQRIVMAGDYRLSNQSEDWVGFALCAMMGLDMDNPAEKKRLGRIVDKWIETGVLQKVSMADGKRRPREFVRAETLCEEAG